MPPTDRETQIARMLTELVPGEVVNQPETTPDTDSRRIKVEKQSEARQRKNAEARRMAQVAARNKILD